MAVVSLEELVEQLPKGKRLLGLDLGTKTLGLALSDVLIMIATPMQTIERVKFTKDVAVLLELAEKQGVGGFVLGLPLNMDGTDGPRAQSTKSFARSLSALTQIPICFWDERLSTQAVTRTLMTANASRAQRKDAVDKMAASYILQGALNRLRDIRMKETKAIELAKESAYIR